MRNFKYFLEKHKILIMIIVIILICSISIAVGVYLQLDSNNKTKVNQGDQGEISYDELKSDFEYIFTNSINKEETAKLDINYDELIYCKYDIDEEKDNYSIKAKIPFFKSENEITDKINQEIFDTFARKIIDIINSESVNATYNIDYVAYANNNILSLVIRCKYKEGSNAQREIIQTYNYDVENKKTVTLQDILEYKGLDKDEVQNKVYDEIKNINNQKKAISDQGYNVYTRDEESQIYKLDNTYSFFIGRNNYLYLVYAYGNNSYTSEIDLVIF